MKTKGFTLIELLIVITILGIIASIVVPNLWKFIGAGKAEAAKTELASVQTAMDLARLDKAMVVLAALEECTSDFTVNIAPEALPPLALYPEYLSGKSAKAVKKGGEIAKYCWTADGRVSSTAIDPDTGEWQ